MSNLITLDQVTLAYGIDPLLNHAKLSIAKDERVCLIGRNGAGKSSLLKMVEGSVLPDSGTVWRKPQLRLARLSQELPQDVTLTVYDYVAQGLADIGNLLAEYHQLILELEHHSSDKQLNRLAHLQQQLDVSQGWQYEQSIKTILDRLELKPDVHIHELSGGWQRRAALAQAFISAPELLLLDEPTNHLDLEGIQWLEDQLVSYPTALLFITHDRALLQRLATRIIELDRGNLTSWPGDYQQFLQHKEELLHAEAKHHTDFDKKLAEEERWIRQGIKARRTRNEGRVRALEALRLERSKRRELQGKVNLNANIGDKSGQLVIEATQVSVAYGDKAVIRDFSTRIMRGDKIGLIGPNGIGKSTLLNVLLGRLSPTQGQVTLGTQLQVAYFDQLRKGIDLEKTVVDNVISGRDTIDINGRSQHIMSYLGDFLFTPQRALTPVKALSGGECNRLLLARLFSQPANLLVMDEPTNDLDIETLELLEELLVNYKGTLLLVSHDRTFLDHVVTSTFAFEGDGNVAEYVGGYQDWLKQRPKLVVTETKQSKVEASKEISKPRKKMSYKDQKELESLPRMIEALEAEQAALQTELANPGFYKQSQEAITATLEKAKHTEQTLEKSYQRWSELDAMSKEQGA